MRPAHRLLFGIALVAGAAAGAALDASIRPSKGIRTVTRSQTDTVVATVRRPASPARRAPAPDLLPGDPNPHHLKLSDAVPADAELTGAWYPAAHQLLVQWDRDFEAQPYEEFGLTLYDYDGRRRQSEYPWRRAWLLRRTETERVAGLRLQVGDFTGDGRADFVVFVDTDGSAGCGTYRAYVNGGEMTRLVLVRPLCIDQGQIVLRRSDLLVTHGVDFAGPGIHCCYRRVRRTILRWDGTRLRIASTRVGRNSRRARPPGAPSPAVPAGRARSGCRPPSSCRD